MKNNVNMIEGSISRGLLSMTIPIMIMNVMQSLFNVMDMLVLSFFADEGAVGAVGVCGSLITLCTCLLIGTSMGANVIVAKRIGAGRKDSADKATMTALLFSIVGGVVISVVGIIFAKKFLIMANCPDSLLSQATLYFRCYFLGVPVFMFYNFCASILRATGDTKKPMYFLILAGVLKIAFTLVFVTVLNMTVDGVAIATIIANLISSALALYTIAKCQNVVTLNFREIKFDAAELKAILYIGIPAGLQEALYSFANVVIAAVVNSFGEAATTGISIANQFDGIMYQICCATSFATAPFVAQNFGAGNLSRVKKTVWWSVFITTAFGASFGSLSAIFSKQLSSILSSDPETIAYSCQKMVLISSTYFICGIYHVMCGVLRGMGKPIVPTICTLVYMCALRFVWVYAIFPLYPNLTFLYTVWPVGWILSIATLLVVYISAIKKMQRQL